MPGISSKQRIALVVFGFFLSVVLLESGLRLAGFIISSIQEHRNLVSLKQKDAYRIICLGESTTAGGKDAYPVQLQDVLNRRFPGIKFSVINRGVPGMSTGAILKALEGNLDKYAPDMVIAMMGINDRYYYVQHQSKPDSCLTGFLKSCRIYKLMTSLQMHIINKATEEKIDNIYSYLYGRIDYSRAEKFIKECIARDPSNSYLYVRLGQWYISQDRLIEARDAFNKAIQLQPDNANAYMELGRCYRAQGKHPEAEEAFYKAIQLKPNSAKAHMELGRCYMAQGKRAKAEDVFRKIIVLHPDLDIAYAHLAFYYADGGYQELADWYLKKAYDIRLKTSNSMTRKNYNELRDILAKRGIRLVCMQYPMLNIGPLKMLFDSTEGVIFVDNERTFKEAVRNSRYEDYFTDNFAGDFGHCSLRGNRLLAENVANAIKSLVTPD